MSEPELKDTKPNISLKDLAPDSAPSGTKKSFPRWLVAVCVVLLICIGLLGGYGAGMGRRYAAQKAANSGQVAEQYQLGVQAVAAGNYGLAKQYFDFVITTDAAFPGIQAAYADLLIQMHVSPTPQFSPTPAVSPTPDTRASQDIFDTALQLLNANDWNGAITNLDSLRKAFPDYRTAEVDGMYYQALRLRGVGKITAACQDTNLEGGIYDLTLAEHFVGSGNLDAVAESLRTYARLYIIGASFWDQDWTQAQNFFAEVMNGYPNMTDSSCMSATKRWHDATIKRAEELFAAGDACGAEQQYTDAFMVSDPFNPTAYPTATFVYDKCHGTGGGGGGKTKTPTPTGPSDVTPPTVETPTDTPVPTETPTEIPPTEIPKK